MDRLTVKPVVKRVNYKEVEALLNNSFSSNDLYTVWILAFLAKRKYVHFDAYYDHNDKLIGTTYLIFHDDLVFVQYLCVAEDERLKGYGSLMLDYIKECYPGSEINLVMENPDFNEEKGTRLEFFKKNGFSSTNTLLVEKKQQYLALSTKDDFNPERFAKILRKLSYGYYHPHLKNWHEEA